MEREQRTMGGSGRAGGGVRAGMPGQVRFVAFRKAHDVAAEPRDNRGRWVSSYLASLPATPYMTRRKASVALNERVFVRNAAVLSPPSRKGAFVDPWMSAHEVGEMMARRPGKYEPRWNRIRVGVWKDGPSGVEVDVTQAALDYRHHLEKVMKTINKGWFDDVAERNSAAVEKGAGGDQAELLERHGAPKVSTTYRDKGFAMASVNDDQYDVHHNGTPIGYVYHHGAEGWHAYHHASAIHGATDWQSHALAARALALHHVQYNKPDSVSKAHVGFDRLESELADKPGVTDPAGLAAAIGRKKFGKRKFDRAAARHVPLEKDVASGEPGTDAGRMIIRPIVDMSKGVDWNAESVKTAQNCPDCHGMGRVDNGWETRGGVSKVTSRGQCQTCHGDGILPAGHPKLAGRKPSMFAANNVTKAADLDGAVTTTLEEAQAGALTVRPNTWSGEGMYHMLTEMRKRRLYDFDQPAEAGAVVEKAVDLTHRAAIRKAATGHFGEHARAFDMSSHEGRSAYKTHLAERSAHASRDALCPHCGGKVNRGGNDSFYCWGCQKHIADDAVHEIHKAVGGPTGMKTLAQGWETIEKAAVRKGIEFPADGIERTATLGHHWAVEKGLVSRDPFARTEIHKEKVGNATCDNCGGQDGRGNVHEFRVESDGGRKYPVKGKFCSASCMRDYHS